MVPIEVRINKEVRDYQESLFFGLGLRRIDALRTLTTEALAVLMPFKAQEIRERGGVYYGQNTISKNLIIANRKELLNGNGFVLGGSGSGKSFAAKAELVNVALATNDDIIVIDPEKEYGPIVEGLGGEVIDISATSRNHINAMDMEQSYGDGENPVALAIELFTEGSLNTFAKPTNVDAGRGLIKCGSAIVPFVNSFPKNTRLYRLMSTKFAEDQAA